MNDDALLRISLVQMDIQWEDKPANLNKVKGYLSGLSGKTDLVILPEMFSTGFSMNSHTLAETVGGQTISSLQNWSKEYDLAICGSYIAEEKDQYFNRGFFITPEDTYFYDKRHLFRMGDESKSFSPGNRQCIIEHKGFNICLLICYDLRFPVWARNVDNRYDLLLYVANWPQSRIKVWRTLLEARALENLSYVCGVNRVGTDGMGLYYNGQSAVIDYKGNRLSELTEPVEIIETVEISKKGLNLFRNKFPVWKDADDFALR
ncbi:nitrilase family protein [Dysgonomonas macrotermitis]|uniref:Omega-amidase YafV n=1 Tax=Dysgonomonas macrotermitis TaxID=1346286 RepID=A0A1M5GQN7_9BACT|nr:nitrilase family protein [Dysgonomonas macrotermitis]SHG06026.1 Predicted amidohydrolase [Dysgonomonas macrotermitis]